MVFNYYDIESLDNVFSICNFQEKLNLLDVYYLCDQMELKDNESKKRVAQEIRNKNKDFTGQVRFFDLSSKEGNAHLAKTFGLSDSEKINDITLGDDSYLGKFRLECDTDSSFNDEKQPYFLGYNSYNYDTTMLAYYLCHAIEPINGGTFHPVSAKAMRVFNDRLFSAEFIKKMPDALLEKKGSALKRGTSFRVRRNMLLSGRYVDVAKLNEKMNHVALKRLLGMLGYQILESDRLDSFNCRIHNLDEFAELIAYNASDVLNLAKLFHHKFYTAQFTLKRQLLKTYPALIYQKKDDEYAPNIIPSAVAFNRMCIDSSSAQFASRALAPYGPLGDIPAVSFLYPSEAKAKERGVKRVDVLEEAKSFFYGLYPVDTDNPYRNRINQTVRSEFHSHFYDYYAQFRDKNFNASSSYRTYCKGNPKNSVYDVRMIAPETDTNMFYFDRNGDPTSAYIKFSIGGLHGAEYNQKLYQQELNRWKEACILREEVMSRYPDAEKLRGIKNILLSDGKMHPVKEFVVEGGDPIVLVKYTYAPLGTKPKKSDEDYEEKIEAYLNKKERIAALKNKYSSADEAICCERDFDDPNERSRYFVMKSSKSVNSYVYRDMPKKPDVFKDSKTREKKLDSKYVYTSSGLSNHEDFTSYYPWLLIGMDAFANDGLGYDRYQEMYEQKELNGKRMKDKDHYSDEERELFKIMREGNKLIINAASGAADAAFENNIRMNNRILSMRIIGQIFSWRIGQAQAYEGAVIPSTNTDGLYTFFDEKKNAEILERESAATGVAIEPEPVFLISKDANNRLEFDARTGDIISAAGGDLGCQGGPTPTKALSHAAILDWSLCEYLICSSFENAYGAAMDRPFVRKFGERIIKSAINKMDRRKWLLMMQTIIASSTSSQRYVYSFEDDEADAHCLQHYNRAFFLKKEAADELARIDPKKRLVHVKLASCRKISTAVRNKRRKEGFRAQIHDPIALKILAEQNIYEANIDAEHEAARSNISGISPELYLLIENHDLDQIDGRIVELIEKHLDYDAYIDRLESSFNANWKNEDPEYNPEQETVIETDTQAA